MSQLLDDIGFNQYYDAQKMQEGWIYVGEYAHSGNVQWDREHKHYECDIVRLSKKYSYVNNSFMPLDGTAYTLSAYIKGRAMKIGRAHV